ncbi:MAG: alkaline phosphatase family protein [Spirochaetes bacterium]|nr:alkaline phosphatase family protein [Spirochaetota bacterium]
MKKIVFIFIDGLGIGNRSENNPFFKYNSGIFSFFDDDISGHGIIKIPEGFLIPLDAQLGMEGAPQSATGQSTLFTGINTVDVLKKHLWGFPNKALRKILMQDNLLLKVKNMGYRSVFLNCYPVYADELSRGLLELNEDGDYSVRDKKSSLSTLLKMISVTTIMALSIRQRFAGIQELIERKCIYQDFTNRLLKKRHPEVPLFSAKEAAYIIIARIKEYDFILYEYFQTDKAGHSRDNDRAKQIAEDLDLFVKTILENLDLDQTVLCICSDHGNFEDLSIRTHTENKIPFYIFTRRELNKSLERLKSLQDVYPFIVDMADY